MNKKYELMADTVMHHQGVTLHRIKALRDFGLVKAGDLGGYVQSEANLSTKGSAWIKDNAKVFDHAYVSGQAVISGNAEVSDAAEVFGNAKVIEQVWIYDNAKVSGNAVVSGGVVVSGNARVYGNAQLAGVACVLGNAKISDDAKVYDKAEVSGNARVCGTAEAKGDAMISGYTKLGNGCKVVPTPVESKPVIQEFVNGQKLEEVYALVLISAGHVAYNNGIPAADAWSREYENEHVEYLTDHDITNEVVQAMLNSPLSLFLGAPTELVPAAHEHAQLDDTDRLFDTSPPVRRLTTNQVN